MKSDRPGRMGRRGGNGQLGPAQGGRGSAWARLFEGGGGGRASRLGGRPGLPARACAARWCLGNGHQKAAERRSGRRADGGRPIARCARLSRGSAALLSWACRGRPGSVPIVSLRWRWSACHGGRWAWACLGARAWAYTGLSVFPMVRWSKASCHGGTLGMGLLGSSGMGLLGLSDGRRWQVEGVSNLGTGPPRHTRTGTPYRHTAPGTPYRHTRTGTPYRHPVPAPRPGGLARSAGLACAGRSRLRLWGSGSSSVRSS